MLNITTGIPDDLENKIKDTIITIAKSHNCTGDFGKIPKMIESIMISTINNYISYRYIDLENIENTVLEYFQCVEDNEYDTDNGDDGDEKFIIDLMKK